MLGPGWENDQQVLGMQSQVLCHYQATVPHMEHRLQAPHCKIDVLPDLLYTDTEHAQGLPASAHAAAVKRSSDAKNQM